MSRIKPITYGITGSIASDATRGIINEIKAGWTPADDAELGSWQKAGLGITESSGVLSNWADQSGEGNDLSQDTAASRPFVNTDTLNGVQVVDCVPSGTNRFLTLDGSNTAAAYPAMPHLSDRRGAIIMVARTKTAINSGALIGLRNTLGADFLSGIWASNRHYYPNETNGYETINPTTMTVGQWHIIAANFTNTDQQFTIDGANETLSGAAGDAATYPFNAFTVGVRAASNVTSNGQFAEIVTRKEPLNAADLDRYVGYMAAEWGLA